MSYVNSKKIYDMISSGKIEALESEYEIEDILSFINSLNDKISFLEGLKKNRVSSIDKEIGKIESQVQCLKDIIMLTLEKNDKKSLSFPNVGKVHIKVSNGKWVIKDEKAVLDIIKSELPKEVVDKIIQTKEVISKVDLNECLDNWEKINKIPDCVTKEDDKKTIIVKVDKNAENIEIEEDYTGSIIKNNIQDNNSGTNGYDKLDEF